MGHDLSSLLREAAAQPTSEVASDVVEVVRLGRARVRRRRRTVAVSVCAAAVAVATTVSVLASGAGLGRIDPAEQRLEPVGPVVSPDDAVPGRAGRDWTQLATWTNDNLNRANGQYLSGVTPDGMALIKDGPHGIRNLVRWGLLQPRSGAVSWLPGTPRNDLERPLLIEDHRIVFYGSVGREAAVIVFDRDAVTWSDPLPLGMSAMEVSQAQLGADDRVYFVEDDGSYGGRLWSRSLNPGDEPRDEGLNVGELVAQGDLLVWTKVTNDPNDQVTIRDLVTGEERTFDPQSGDRCNQLSLQVAGEHLVLGQYCGTTNGGRTPVRDDRVQVVDLEGDPVVTVRGHGVEAGTASADGVVVTAYGSIDDPDGTTYLWHFERGELLELADSRSNYSWTWLPDHSVLTWTEATNGRRGAAQVIATLE
ncbi:hypothetical protein ACFP3Q_07725 [Nocardioides sp. GCM10027113]|uniref:hypothetical protein n=1 Tax=unclassified Nocardioides TaxID=2615069 RepID=UPI00361695A6